MRLLTLMGVLVLVAPPFTAAQGVPSPACSPWRSLFDGKDPSAWRGFRQEGFPDKGWMVADGCLAVAAGGGGGDIVTREEYGDFELRFEWKVAAGANSGVMYRVTEDESASWRTGPEYQILDDAGHADGRDPKTGAAALYALYAGEAKETKPVGEFNEGRIVVRGGRVEHWLNGARVLSFELGSEDFKSRVAASKFASMPSFGTRPRGRICLQDHGDAVWYRNLRIRTFQTENEVALFNGRDLQGWTGYLQEEGRTEEVWSVTPEEILVCRGQPTGYLQTTREYGNFILRLDWRYDPVTRQGGNSGVLLRLTGPAKIWPHCLEAQLRSGSAGDFWCMGDFPVTVDPARSRGRNIPKLVDSENPVGEWNTYEIEMDGGEVELRINGRVVNRASGAEEIPGKIGLQSEGAEIHFRDIRLLAIGG